MDIADTLSQGANLDKIELTPEIMATMPPKPEIMREELYLKVCKAFYHGRELMKDTPKTDYSKPYHYHPRWCGMIECPECMDAVNRDPAINPHCPVCKGGGFVYMVVDGQILYNKLIRCPAPDCISYPSETKQKKEHSKLQTFGTFNDNDCNIKALRACQAFVKLETPPIIFIYGGLGSGKSHLCHAIALDMARSGWQVKYTTVKDFYGKMKEAIDNHNVEDTLQEYMHAEVLIFDDYDPETYKNDSWFNELFERIVDYRYRAARWFVLTSNFDWKAHSFPPRIESRLKDKEYCLIVKNRDIDRRPKKELQEKMKDEQVN